jgi:hypothetical protein
MSQRIRIAAIAAAALAFAAPPVTAQPQVQVDGIGAALCSKVTTDFKFDATGTGNALVQWTYGYMTRRNVERRQLNQDALDIAKAVDDDKLLRVILQTCENKPELRIFQVVDSLYDLLLEKHTLTS